MSRQIQAGRNHGKSNADEMANAFVAKLTNKENKMSTINLTDDQCSAIIKLINDEKKLNMDNGDGSYNIYWDNIIIAMGFAVIN